MQMHVLLHALLQSLNLLLFLLEFLLKQMFLVTEAVMAQHPYSLQAVQAHSLTTGLQGTLLAMEQQVFRE
jgi:hypothetical protein